MEENHSGPMAGHFSGNCLYNTLARDWWWEGMHTDTQKHCKSCPQCALVSGTKRAHKTFLHPIPVQRPFQIVGVGVMDLPKTDQGNKNVIVFLIHCARSSLTVPRLDRSCCLIPMAIPVFESHSRVLEFGVHKLVTRGRSLWSSSYGQF